MDDDYGVFAEYGKLKSAYINLYIISSTNLAEYVVSKNPNRKRDIIKSLTKLAYLLFPKMYILKDKFAGDYIAYFMRNPQNFQLMDIQTTFLICQRLLEKMGLTKIEQFQLPKNEAWRENDN